MPNTYAEYIANLNLSTDVQEILDVVPFDPLPKWWEDSAKFQRDEARYLRALYHWGDTKIWKLLKARYPDKRILSREMLRQAYEGIDLSDVDLASQPDYDPQYRYQDSQYIYRINLICERLRYRKLKADEALMADRLMMGLKGLDLVTAFIIIEEYYERTLNTKTPQNDDLDLMVATTPWASGDDELFYNQMRTSRNMRLPNLSKLQNPKLDVDYYIAFHVASVLKQHVAIRGETVTIIIPQIASTVLNKANEKFEKFGFPDPAGFARTYADAVTLRGMRVERDKEIAGNVTDLTGYEPFYKKNYQSYMHVLRAVWVSELTEEPPYSPFVEVSVASQESRVSQPVQPLGLSPAERHEREANVDRYFDHLAEEQRQELDQEDFTGDRHEEDE